MTPPASSEARQAYQRFQETKYFGGLDALRALAVTGVLWFHLTPRHEIHLLNQGPRGVTLFFAISGFLVTTLLLREYRRMGAISLRNFYMRRTLRIFPLYYTMLGLYAVLVFVVFRGTPKAQEFWANLPSFATYTSNWFVTGEAGAAKGVTFYFAWSLATEEQFYLFWPCAMTATLWFTRSQRTLLAVLLAILAVQVIASQSETSLPQTILASLDPAIIFGVGFAILLDDRRSFEALYPTFARRWVAPLGLGVVLLTLQFSNFWLLNDFVLAAFVAVVCMREDTFLHPILRWRPAVFLGTISYGVYLMHMLMANVVRQLLHHDVGLDVFACTLPLTVGAAYLSFRYFEAPILKLKSKFAPGALAVSHPAVARVHNI